MLQIISFTYLPYYVTRVFFIYIVYIINLPHFLSYYNILILNNNNNNNNKNC